MGIPKKYCCCSDHLCFVADYMEENILHSDVLYIEATHKYCVVHVRKLGMLKTYVSLCRLQIQLPYHDFFQASRSLTVSRGYIKDVLGYNVILKDGRNFKLPKKNYFRFMKWFRAS